jgi:hypothetical protein
MANDTIQANSSERIRALVTLSVPAIIFGVLSKRYVMCPSVVYSMRMLMLVFLSLMREISCDRSWAPVQYFFPVVSFISHRQLFSSWRTRRRLRIPEALEVSEITTTKCPVTRSSDRGLEEYDSIFSSTERRHIRAVAKLFLTYSSTLPLSTAQVRKSRLSDKSICQRRRRFREVRFDVIFREDNR